MGADADRTDAQGVTVDPVSGEVDFGLDGCPVPDLEHAGDRRQGVQVDIMVDLRAESTGVIGDPRRPDQAHGAHQVGGLLSQPQPQVHTSTSRIVAGANPGEQ